MDEFFTPKAYKEEIRAINPQAFALSANEAIRVQKIASIIRQVFDMHREFVQNKDTENGGIIRTIIFNAQSVALIKKCLKEKRVNLNNAYRVAQRVLSANWWQLMPIALSITREGDPTLYLRSSGDAQGYITREQYPEFYEVYDSQDDIIRGYKLGGIRVEALRDALGLDDSYLYLDGGELYALSLIRAIAEFKEPFVRNESEYITIKSSPATTALAITGAKAYRDAEQIDDEDQEAGFEIHLTARSAFRYTGELDTLKSLSVNASKLILQIVSESISQGRWVRISLREYMELRGLRDEKTARKQYQKATEVVSRLQFSTKSNGRFTFINFLQAGNIVKGEGVFLINELFYQYYIERNGSKAQIPKSFFTIPASSPNAWAIVNRLYTHRKINLGRDTENRIAITTLLGDTTLPLAETIENKRLKSYIIDRFFEALNTARDITKEFTYTIVESGGARTNEYEAYNNYWHFIKCLIQVKWNGDPYPEARQKKIEAYRRRQERLESEAETKPVKKKRKSKKA